MNTRNIIIEKYIATSFGGDFQQFPTKIKQFKFNYAPHMPEDKNALMLDIGIGRGEMLTLWKEMGYTNYMGVDISPENVQFSKSLELNAECIEDTAEYLRSRPNTFDFISILDVIEHFPKNDVIEILVLLKNSLKSGGILIVQTPNAASLFASHHRYNDITHEFVLNEHSFNQLLIGANFQSFKIMGFEEFRCLNFLYNLLYFLFRDLLLWPIIKVLHIINGIRPPQILHPVFYCLATKT